MMRAPADPPPPLPFLVGRLLKLPAAKANVTPPPSLSAIAAAPADIHAWMRAASDAAAAGHKHALRVLTLNP